MRAGWRMGLISCHAPLRSQSDTKGCIAGAQLVHTVTKPSPARNSPRLHPACLKQLYHYSASQRPPASNICMGHTCVHLYCTGSLVREPSPTLPEAVLPHKNTHHPCVSTHLRQQRKHSLLPTQFWAPNCLTATRSSCRPVESGQSTHTHTGMHSVSARHTLRGSSRTQKHPDTPRERNINAHTPPCQIYWQPQTTGATAASWAGQHRSHTGTSSTL
jgi:hypothetical protein